jgi:hypothetical protein
MANPPGSEWLTVSQVAEVLGTSTETVRRMIKAGELPASRASEAKRAPWLIHGPTWEHQREADIERAAIRQRLAGVVTGYGEDFARKVEAEYPDARVGSPGGPTLAEHTRAYLARQELFGQIQRDMRADPALRQRFEQLDENERFEAEARELARRVRRERQLWDRALEILDENDED